MATFGVVEDSDGKFLEGGSANSADEMDFPRAVIDLVKTCEIPPMYFRNRIFSPHSQDMSSLMPASKPASRHRLIHREWGKSVSRRVEGQGVMALLTIDDQALDEDKAKRIAHYIQNILKETQCEFLKWDQQCLLLYFSSPNDYQRLGERFMHRELDDCAGSRVMQLEAAKLTNPPRSLIEISVPRDQGDSTRHTISSFLSYFSGAFTHATIMEEDNSTASAAVSSDGIPSMGVVMMFQSGAGKVQEVFSSQPWKSQAFSDEVSQVEFATQFYVHTQKALPFWGVRTGAPANGVRLLLFVRDPRKFDVMDEFYQQFTGVTPLEHKSTASALRYSTYTLSPRCEFTLAHYPGLKPYSVDSLSMGFHIRNLNKAAGAERLNDDHWSTRDPEDNKVTLFSVRR
ncbi:uncharacterized protein LOC100889127 [Strongylocentrotus purpuratus]|uniref:FAM124 domain-containing protein n=1 Tax=Strongylocentrotus purpuratus TaxID=7668 RepID=A0A7M7GL20_STRPU|nr:uncharacterized protein LOC100889127 [Strongylocentrotus purpuratus]